MQVNGFFVKANMAGVLRLALMIGACSGPSKTSSPTALASFETAWCEQNSSQVLAKAQSMQLVQREVDIADYKSADDVKVAIQKNNTRGLWPKYHLPDSTDLKNLRGYVYRWISAKNYPRICRAAYNER